jgi:hypothetical protein
MASAHDQSEGWLEVPRRLKGHKTDDSEIVKLHHNIVETVQVETALGAGSWKDVIRSDSTHSRKRFPIACSIQIFQQLGRINAIIYYSGTLFSKSIGFDQTLLGSDGRLFTNLVFGCIIHPMAFN